MNPIREYHAHVYFTPDVRDGAFGLHARVQAELGARVRAWPPRERPVGPHPMPMFELNFAPGQLEAVATWLMANHGPHPVLIHPDTGDDLADHRDHALWLGGTLPLDLSVL